MPNTTRMGWPYPAEYEDPWWAKFEQLIASIDLAAYSAREDRNIVVTGGGLITFDSSSNVVSWAQDLALVCSNTGLLWTILAGSVSLSPGQVAYVILDRAPTANRSLTMQSAQKVPNDDGAFLLFVRKSNELFIRSGIKIPAGIPTDPSIPVPAMSSGQILVGSASNVATAVTMSGDVTVDIAGAMTIGAGAVTPAKADLTAAWDFNTAGGSVQVPLPTNPTDAASKTWVEQIPHRISASGRATVEGDVAVVILDSFDFNASEYPSGVSFYFVGIMSVSDVLRTATLTLWDVGNGELSPITGATLTSSSLSPEKKITAALTVGAGVGELKTTESLYEVRLEVDGGTPGDFGILGSSYILIKG